MRNQDASLRRATGAFLGAMSRTARTATDLIAKPALDRAEDVVRCLADAQVAAAQLTTALAVTRRRGPHR